MNIAQHAKQIVLLTVVVCFGCGCVESPAKWHHAPDNRVLPDDWSQAVVPLGQERATRRLDYNSLYVADPATLFPDFRDHWFRFWPNGRVFEKASFRFRNDRHPPTAAEADDFRVSGAGYFSIVGDRITLEFITPNVDDPFGARMKYDDYKGHVNEDGSFTLEEPSGDRSIYGIGLKPRYQTYRPLRTEGMQRQPDW